tara:strand:- start:1179 stop:2408 length:1230 start_codon:yes stop_codon:yes gene_type:complete
MKYYEELFNPFFLHKDKFHKKNYNIKSIDTILKSLYKKIDSIKKIKNKVIFKQKKIKNFQDVKSNLINSKFVPNNIRKKMQNINHMYSYIFNIKKGNDTIEINVNFLLHKQENTSKYNVYIKKIIFLMNFLLSYSNNNTKSFSLYLYLSNFKKVLPNNELIVLNPNNCNTGVTYACAINGECLIYREEEWFKVLIHETMHAFCLDFSISNYNTLKNKIKKIFPIKSDFQISETYSETWAMIIKNVFISYELNEKDRYHYFYSLMQLEIYFSMFQMMKILNFMNIYKYEYLYIPSKKPERNIYKEDTNIFAYYILKTISIYNYIDFLHFCKKNNNNLLNFNKKSKMGNNIYTKYYHFFKTHYNNSDFLLSCKKMELFYNKLYSKNKNSKNKNGKNKNVLLDTMRMSSIEY